MKKIIAAPLIALTALAFLATPALAGPYVGVNLGQSSLGLKADSVGADRLSGKTSGAPGIFIGHQRGRYLATEMSFTDMGKVSLHAGDTKIDVKSRALGFALVGSVPVTKQLDVLAKAGYALSEARAAGEKGYHGAPVVGLGAQYNLSPAWAVTALHEHYRDFADTGATMKVTSAGLKYRF